MLASNMNSVYKDILDAIFENGRLELFTEHELEIMVRFEASQRRLSQTQIEEAIAYAKAHSDVERDRQAIIEDALENAVIAAQEVAGEHPDPDALLRDLKVMDEFTGALAISGDAWGFWPEQLRQKALQSAEETFRSRLPWSTYAHGHPRAIR